MFNKIGSIVVIELEIGEIFVMVSIFIYDFNELIINKDCGRIYVKL